MALLATWDILGEGRTFLDPMSAEEVRGLEVAKAATWTSALGLARAVAAEASEAPRREDVDGRGVA